MKTLLKSLFYVGVTAALVACGEEGTKVKVGAPPADTPTKVEKPKEQVLQAQSIQSMYQMIINEHNKSSLALVALAVAGDLDDKIGFNGKNYETCTATGPVRLPSLQVIDDDDVDKFFLDKYNEVTKTVAAKLEALEKESKEDAAKSSLQGSSEEGLVAEQEQEVEESDNVAKDEGDDSSDVIADSDSPSTEEGNDNSEESVKEEAEQTASSSTKEVEELYGYAYQVKLKCDLLGNKKEQLITVSTRGIVGIIKESSAGKSSLKVVAISNLDDEVNYVYGDATKKIDISIYKDKINLEEVRYADEINYKNQWEL